MIHLVSSLGSLTATLAVGAFGWWLFADDGPPDDGGGGDWEPILVPRAPCSASLRRRLRTACARTRPNVTLTASVPHRHPCCADAEPDERQGAPLAGSR